MPGNDRDPIIWISLIVVWQFYGLINFCLMEFQWGCRTDFFFTQISWMWTLSIWWKNHLLNTSEHSYWYDLYFSFAHSLICFFFRKAISKLLLKTGYKCHTFWITWLRMRFQQFQFDTVYVDVARKIYSHCLWWLLSKVLQKLSNFIHSYWLWAVYICSSSV